MGEGRDCDRCHFEKNVMNDKQKFLDEKTPS